MISLIPALIQEFSLNLINVHFNTDELDLLPPNLTHYLVPDCQIAREYLEILETPEIHGIIFTQTAEHSVSLYKCKSYELTS